MTNKTWYNNFPILQDEHVLYELEELLEITDREYRDILSQLEIDGESHDS